MHSSLYVCSHHKTGTVLLKNIFTEFCKHTKFTFKDITHNEDTDQYLNNHILFDEHSKNSVASKLNGIRIIRHPKDVIISGAKYHCISNESWLHKKNDGVTYQEKINSFETFQEKLMFEMHHIGKHTINDMIHFSHSNVMTIKYEDLIVDVNGVYLSTIAQHLNLNIIERKKLFEAFKTTSHVTYGRHIKNNHINNGSPSQWVTTFNDDLNKKFDELFPNAINTLGYDK